MPKGSAEAAKTHCPQGHAYDEANTRTSGGCRHCRACERDRDRAQRRAGGKVIVLHADKTHCPRGHAYNEANTRVSTQGGRQCRACDLIVQNERNNANPARMMWKSAQTRARKRGVPFTITVDDIVIPPCCPVLGVPLERKASKGPGPCSPSLDRIEPAKGYVAGNIIVVSLRANRIKNDATLEELERVTAWLRTTMRKDI